MANPHEPRDYDKAAGRLQALIVVVLNNLHVLPFERALVPLMTLLQDFVAVFVYKIAQLVRWHEYLKVCFQVFHSCPPQAKKEGGRSPLG